MLKRFTPRFVALALSVPVVISGCYGEIATPAAGALDTETFGDTTNIGAATDNIGVKDTEPGDGPFAADTQTAERIRTD